MYSTAKRALSALSIASLTFTIIAATIVGSGTRADAANYCSAVGYMNPSTEAAYVRDYNCRRIGVQARYRTASGALYLSHAVINSRSDWGYLIVGVGVAPSNINSYRGCSGTTWSHCSISALKYSTWKWNTSWGTV